MYFSCKYILHHMGIHALSLILLIKDETFSSYQFVKFAKIESCSSKLLTRIYATVDRTDTKQLGRVTIACNPAAQPTQCLTMTCKGCTANVARQDCVAKLLRVYPL